MYTTSIWGYYIKIVKLLGFYLSKYCIVNVLTKFVKLLGYKDVN